MACLISDLNFLNCELHKAFLLIESYFSWVFCCNEIKLMNTHGFWQDGFPKLHAPPVLLNGGQTDKSHHTIRAPDVELLQDQRQRKRSISCRTKTIYIWLGPHLEILIRDLCLLPKFKSDGPCPILQIGPVEYAT